MSEEKKYYCQYCGAELKQDPQNENSMLCFGCKRRFNKEEVVQWAMFVLNSPTLTSKSGGDVGSDDAKLSAEPEKAESKSSDGKSSDAESGKKLILIICIVVAVLAAVAIGAFAILGQNVPDNGTSTNESIVTKTNEGETSDPSAYDMPSYAQFTMSQEELDKAYEHYALPPYVEASESAPWGEMKFTYDGQEYQIGNMTLKEFEEKSGFLLDMARYGLSDDYDMASGDSLEFAELSCDNNKVTAQIAVANLTDVPLNIHDCIVTGFDIRTFTIVPNTGIVGTDIKIGSSADAAIKGLGDPFKRQPGENTEVIEFKDASNMLDMAVYNRQGAIEGFKLFMYDDNY